MKPEALAAVSSGSIPKGDVLATARIAAIQASKRTSELIPLCHPLAIEHIAIGFSVEKNGIRISAKVTSWGRTGVEMEALTAVSVAALTIYDMCKAVDKRMTVEGICLLEKSGGRSGHYSGDVNEIQHEANVEASPDSRQILIVATCLSQEKGTPKAPVDKITLIENYGVEGDAHAGPGQRQVSLIGMETIRRMCESGYEAAPGDFGENITIEGIVLNKLAVGTRLMTGNVELVVTQIGKECHRGCAIREIVRRLPDASRGNIRVGCKGRRTAARRHSQDCLAAIVADKKDKSRFMTKWS